MKRDMGYEKPTSKRDLKLVWMFRHPCIDSFASITMLATSLSIKYLTAFGLCIAALPSCCVQQPDPGYYATKARLSLPSLARSTFAK